MAEWQKHTLGDLPTFQATAIAAVPGIVQGFSTRQGGVSAAPYDSLNLGSHVGDNLRDVLVNRQRVWANLGFTESEVALAEQVHGDGIGVVKVGTGGQPLPGVDALVTDLPHLLLMLFFADCVPVYLVDPKRRAIGLVHAGWRGAAADITGKTVQKIAEEFGSEPSSCLAAIGPCIRGESYEVGPEVAAQFAPHSAISGASHLDLRQVIFRQLLAAGLPTEAIAVSDEDSFQNKQDFFSYRRDGITGRMAAFLGMK